MKTLAFVLILVLFVTTGCATSTGYMREDLKARTGEAGAAKLLRYDESDIEKIFSKPTNLPRPFTMAVYFKESSPAAKEWRWSLEDKKQLVESLRKELPQDQVSQIFLMDESLAVSTDIRSIRLAAAKYRADAVLVVDGIGDVWRRPNRWAASYLLVLPTLFVNGNSLNAYFLMKASLWDVRNEVLYASLSAESEWSENYPFAAGEENKKYFDRVKLGALENMKKHLKEDLRFR